MKNFCFSILLLGLFLLSLAVESQIPNCPIKKIGGIEYYTYTVGTSEGLYAISHKFGVSQADISKANPTLESGIRAGQQILVPVQTKMENKPKTVTSKTKDVEFIQHKVEKKQTLFAISHKYNVSQEEISFYNPQLTNGLNEGDILKIPVKKEETKPNPVASTLAKHSTPEKNSTVSESKHLVIHKVEPKETLYSISKLYKVNVVDIIELNPLAAGNLVVGSELKIQTTQFKSESENKNSVAELQVESVIATQKNEDQVMTVAAPDNNKTIRIAFILPFMLDLDKEDKTKERFVDFYSGALLALQEAKQKGISLEVFTFDTGNTEDKIKEILGHSELKTVDLIIGPAFSSQIPLVSDFAQEHKINTLIPFSSKVHNLEKNPYLLQFNPGQEAELKTINKLVNEKLTNMNVIFAQIPSILPTDGGLQFSNGLQKELTKQHKTFSIIPLNASKKDNFKTAFVKGKKNLIVFNTDKFAYVNSYLSQLKLSATENEVVLFEQYNWKNQAIKIPSKISISPFISNPDSTELVSFNKKFNSNFHREAQLNAPRYDLLGYDLTNYFIALIHRYGPKLSNEISSFTNINGIQSQPRFEQKSSESGFINQQLYIGEEK
jgi:LysM repeat protein